MIPNIMEEELTHIVILEGDIQFVNCLSNQIKTIFNDIEFINFKFSIISDISDFDFKENAIFFGVNR